MKRTTRIRRQIYVAAMFAAFTAAVIAVPLLVGTRDSRMFVHGVAVLAASTDRVTLAEPVTILSTPNVTLESGTVAVAHTRTDAPGKSPRIDEHGSNTSIIHPERLVIENAVIRIKLSSTPSPGAQTSSGVTPNNASTATLNSAFAPILDALKRHDFNTLSMRDCTVLVAPGGAAAYRLDNVQLDVGQSDGHGINVNGTFRYRGETLKLSSRFADGLSIRPATSPKANHRISFKARVEGILMNANLDGNFVFGPRPQITAKRTLVKFNNLGSVGRWLGLSWHANSLPREFSVLGDLKWTASSIAFQSATIRHGRNNANGTLSLSYGSDRPLFDATLAARDLDLTGYFAIGGSETAPLLIEPATWLSELGRYTRFGSSTGNEMASVLRSIDADIRVSADQVTTAGMKLGRSAATVSLRAGRLLADIAKVELPEGGNGNIQISLDVNGPNTRTGIRARLNGIDATKVTALAFGRPFLMGRGEIVLDISGDGNSRYQFSKSMSGKVAFNVPGPAKLALDLDALMNSDNLEKKPQAGWGRSANGTTSLSQVSINLEFKDGVARIRNVSAIAGKAALSIAGEIEFPTKALDLRINVTNHHSATPPSDAEATGRTGKTLHATGHWAHPSILSTDHADGSRDMVPGQTPKQESADQRGG